MSDCCSAPKGPESKPLPEIRVNGVAIDETEYAQELQYHQAGTFESALQKAGQALVIRQLLINEAGEEAANDEEAAIQKLISDNSVFESPSEEDCSRYFDNNTERFKTDVLMEVDHILLAVPEDDIEGRQQARVKAESIIEQLVPDVSQFAVLAGQYSACPSKETGGSLGQIGKGQTVPEFEKQLTRLSEGLADSPIESRYGFHVVRVNKKIDGTQLAYPMVEEKIKQYLTQRASQLSIQAFIHTLVEKADIEGIKVGFSDENIVI